ncbi:phosphoribosylanthranilate isomerase [Desulfopila sp. IMCC35006]|nr:phosphoribosylanthranilate isomerase [Desulfopila sp. IMCC35006]
MCGTTRLEDALAAVDSGVDALGFIFYRKSLRCISRDAAYQIIQQLPPFVDRVAVFVDASMAELVSTAERGFSFVQLHGTESADYCRQIRQKLPLHGIIKAFRVGEKSCIDEFTPYNDCVDAFLLDTFVKGARGGTGEIFDWSIIERLKLQRPVILAGGLSPENVAGAIAAVHPYAVDINSGVESQPGVKNHARLRELLRSVYHATIA